MYLERTFVKPVPIWIWGLAPVAHSSILSAPCQARVPRFTSSYPGTFLSCDLNSLGFNNWCGEDSIKLVLQETARAAVALHGFTVKDFET